MAFLSGADGGTRTRDLFLTKEVLYLLSYISVSMILTVCGDLSLPAFLPPDGFTPSPLYPNAFLFGEGRVQHSHVRDVHPMKF